MDRLKVKKKLYAGLGDFARQQRGQELRKKYSTGSPELDAASEAQEEAAEAAELPSIPASKPLMDSSDIDSGASDAAPAIEDAMSAMAEDEEEAKWMAKQRG